MAAQPFEEDLLISLPEGIWIRGTKVKLIDTKSCWAKKEKPVLYGKVGGKFKPLAKGKLVESPECDGKQPYEAVYKFTLKDGGGAKKLTLRSGGSAAGFATYKRTVYSSVSEFNDVGLRLLGIIDDLVTGGSNSSDSPTGGGSFGSSSGWSGCYFNGQKMWGTVKVVDYGLADFEVKIDNLLPDLKVKESNLPFSCGEWKFIDYGLADFTIKFVNILPDFTIKFVDYFPGR